MKSIDRKQLLNGVAPCRELSIRRKEGASDVPGSLESSLRDGLDFCSGFNIGQEIGLPLESVVLPYIDPLSFNDLPIPESYSEGVYP